jgi:hypothetical protein
LLLRPVVAPACRESKLRLDDFGGERFRVKHTPPIEVGPVAPNIPPPPPYTPYDCRATGEATMPVLHAAIQYRW